MFDWIQCTYDCVLRGISDNNMKNMLAGNNHRPHLPCKHATLEIDQFRALLETWGAPERTVSCFREPAGASSPQSGSSYPVEQSAFNNCVSIHSGAISRWEMPSSTPKS